MFWLVFVISSDNNSSFVSDLSEGEEQLLFSDYVLQCAFLTCVGFSSCPAHLSSGITPQWAAGDQVSFVKAMSEEV